MYKKCKADEYTCNAEITGTKEQSRVRRSNCGRFILDEFI